MTCEIVFKVNADTRLSPTEKVVFTNIAGGYQTRAEIARVSGCAESSVPRAVRKLEEYGYLKREFVDGKANKYVILGVADTGITQDTRIHTGRTAKRRGVAKDTGVNHPVDTPQSVDNHAPHIEHASARVEDNLLTSKNLELYSERVELAVTVPAKVLNGSARGLPAQRLAEVLADHANNPFLDPSKYDGLRTTCGRIHRWITAGADFDADILPTVVRIMAKASKPVRSWGYFEDAVREATATRLASEAPMEIITPSEAMNDQRNRYPSDEGTYTRRKRSRHIDALFADESDGPPKHLGRLDFSSGK